MLLDFECNRGLFSLPLSPSVSFFLLPLSVLWSSCHVCDLLHICVHLFVFSVSFPCLCVSLCLPPHTTVCLSISPRLSSHACCFLCIDHPPPCLCLSVCPQLLASVSLSISLPMICCSRISLSLPTIHSLTLISYPPSSGAGGPATDAGETRAGGLGEEEAG